MKKVNELLIMALGNMMSASCTQHHQGDNVLTPEEQQEGWELLFDGKTTNGWHLYNHKNTPSVWEVKEGELICSPGNKMEHGDLVTDNKYENFELKFDWKLGKEGNSGVFINVLECEDIPTAWASGPEYQLLEPSHHDFKKESKRAGCLYSFSPQLNKVDLKPHDQWNNSLIKQQNGKIEFFLNGKLPVKQDFTSQQWKDTVAKFRIQGFP